MSLLTESAGYVGDFNAGDSVQFMWASNAAAGESITRSTDGTVQVYKDGGTTQSVAGVTDTEDFDTLAGLHDVTIDLSADATFYAEGSDYTVVLSAGTINTKVVNTIIGSFSIKNRAVSTIAAPGGSLNFPNEADNVDASIKSIAFDGVETAGTNASINAAQGTYHNITHSANNIDIVYQFDVGGGRTASELVWIGYLNSNNDTATIQVYNGSSWDTLATISGKNGTGDDTIAIPLLATHTGTGSDIGKVFVRIECAAMTSPDLFTNQMLVEAVNIGQTVGYANGQVSVDTVGGVAGTESFVNGVADNPTNLMASGFTIATAVGLVDFHIINASAITLAASAANKSFFGDHWTLALGGQACGGIYVQGASVTGIGTSAGEEMHFEGCDIGTSTMEQAHFDKCGFTGTLTMNTADDYEFHYCYDKTATAAIFTKTAGQAITAEWVAWSGSITISGVESGDAYILAGTELGDIVLNGAEGTVEIRGIYQSITDNRTGTPTLTISGAIKAADVAATLVDTGTTIPATLGTAGAGLTDLGGMSTAMKAEVNVEVADVINTDATTLPGQAAPSNTPNLRDMIGWLYKVFRNRETQGSNGEWKLYADDGTTVDAKTTVTDDNTTFDKPEIESGP